MRLGLRLEQDCDFDRNWNWDFDWECNRWTGIELGSDFSEELILRKYIRLSRLLARSLD